jgi:hypothetical protein
MNIWCTRKSLSEVLSGISFKYLDNGLSDSQVRNIEISKPVRAEPKIGLVPRVLPMTAVRTTFFMLEGFCSESCSIRLRFQFSSADCYVSIIKIDLIHTRKADVKCLIHRLSSVSSARHSIYWSCFTILFNPQHNRRSSDEHTQNMPTVPTKGLRTTAAPPQ